MSASSPISSAGGHQPVAPGPAAAAKLLAGAKADNVNPHSFFPPNLVYAPTLSHGVIVSPGYPQAPDPAGLGSYGVINSSGTPRAITIDTTSYKASLSLNSLYPYYLTTGAAESFTSQLNVVVNNVTLFGNHQYSFWAQDVLHYDAYSGQFQMENNVWNFTNTAFVMPQQTFFHGVAGYTNGTDASSGTENFYYVYAPLFNGVYAPFTTVFFVNVTTLYDPTTNANYTELDFDYQLLNGVGAQVEHGMFDRVLFNNTGFTGPIPQAKIHVDGSNLTGTGFIPYDAEIMLGGPGGGSTATFDQLNATMTLQHWNSTLGSYVNEPSAWSLGSETGETCVGVAEYYDSNDVVHLSAGPQFVQPFWNSSATALAGAAVVKGTVSPSNSWTFVSEGASYDVATSAWAPLPPTGTYQWNLTSGTYTVKVMESDYDAVSSSGLALTTTTATTYSVGLIADMTQGVYTPLYAWDNAQLAAISSGGSGTLGSPYQLLNNEIGPLAPEFATFNDYMFPSYAGISLVGTTDYVEIANPAPFAVNFWGAYYNFTQRDMTPTSNDLSIWLYGTADVSIVGGTIQGWFSANLDGFPYANVVVWNSTSTLVTGVNFEVSADAIFAYGGTGNSFVGNTFSNAVVSGNLMIAFAYAYFDFNLPPTFYGIYSVPLGVTGIVSYEGGDSIWDNYFGVSVTAFGADLNVFDDSYPTAYGGYNNSWNLSAPISSSAVTTINGISITGSTSGSATVCGNWWWNYVAGSQLPYNNQYPGEVPYYTNSGNIQIGGDSCPSGPVTYSVPIADSGLAAGGVWGVTVTPAPTQTLPYGGSLVGPAPTNLAFALPIGQYTATLTAPAGYTPLYASVPFEVAAGGAIVSYLGAGTSVPAVFVQDTGILAFAESGLPSGTAWSVTVGSTTLSGNTPTLEEVGLNASYSYTVGSVAGFSATPASGTATIPANSAMVYNIVFSPSSGTLSGTVSPGSASVWVDGTAATVTAGSFSVTVTGGTHSVEATASGYYPYYNNVTVPGGGTKTVTISLNPVTPPIGPDGTLSLAVTPTTASVWVDGTMVTLSSGAYSSSETPGAHSVEVTESGYYSYYNNVSVSSSTTSSLTVSLNPVVPPVGPDGTLSVSITQPPSGASLWVDGSQVSLTGSSYTASLAPGVHSIVVSAPNYYTYYNNVTIKSGVTSSVPVSLNAVGSSSSSSSSSSGISTNAWIIIGVLAALAIILLITTLVFAGRSKKGSSSMSDNDNSGSGGSS